MTTTMTRDQAQAQRTARATEAKLLSRKTRHELVAILRNECGALGTYSKDEAIAALLEARYPLARENEAIHVLHHDVTWPGCPYC